MILTTLLQVSLVLAGIILFTIMFFLVVYITSNDTSVEKMGHEKSGFSGKEYFQKKVAQRAIIRCNQIPPSVPIRYPTMGYTDCRTQNNIFNGNLVCEHGCLGLGSCVTVCPNDAIVLYKGIAQITDACTGCGFCIEICPKKLISLVPVTDIRDIFCAACSKTDASAYCKTAAGDYTLNFHNLP